MTKQNLKTALDRYKGVDHKLEHQKKLQKKAEKRKRSRAESGHDEELLKKIIDEGKEDIEKHTKSSLRKTETNPKSKINGKPAKVAPIARLGQDKDKDDHVAKQDTEDVEGWETDESEDAELEFDTSRIDDSESSSSEDEDLNQDTTQTARDTEGDPTPELEEEEDVPLSDIESLASEEKGDIIPYQRLTINNTAALLRAHKSIALPGKLPFSATQSLTTSAPVDIPDVEDDLNRELAFYKQSFDAVARARKLLKDEGLPFSRPTHYFAEMVKSDEHMGKIKQKLVDEAASKKASADARRQRDLKKFGKQVQVAKLQDRDRAKRDTMEKINTLKRKRQGAELGATEDDLFDVALEDTAATEKDDRAARRTKGSRDGQPNFKRTKRDEKYGFGGKKRFAKSNDAKSSADTSGYSVKRMKGGLKKGPKRLGKSRRGKAG
ncbi:rRNA-processing protein EBP2 [Elasticomyces elasticus]|nr:hypothetical protein LTR28_002007 [Elasticomyces elasticus]KAK4988395.1 rRNA-processing protein EBP2 [Elasticomyces elasticus]